MPGMCSKRQKKVHNSFLFFMAKKLRDSRLFYDSNREMTLLHKTSLNNAHCYTFWIWFLIIKELSILQIKTAISDYASRLSMYKCLSDYSWLYFVIIFNILYGFTQGIADHEFWFWATFNNIIWNINLLGSSGILK